jgi:hypothetical protein
MCHSDCIKDHHSWRRTHNLPESEATTPLRPSMNMEICQHSLQPVFDNSNDFEILKLKPLDFYVIIIEPSMLIFIEHEVLHIK